MFFPSPYTWKMMKDTPNNVMIKMIGLAQTSREIIEDGDVPGFLVVLSTLDSLHCGDRTHILLSTLCVEVSKICT